MATLFDEIDRIARKVEIPKGSLLFGCGDPVFAIYTVRKGSIALFVSRPQEESRVGTRGPGALIGLPATLNGYYSTGAEAAEDCEVGYLVHDRLLELLNGNRDLRVEAMRIIAEETARIRTLIVGDGRSGTPPSQGGK